MVSSVAKYFVFNRHVSFNRWQVSNLEFFNFDSSILPLNQIFHASQIYSNRVLNMQKCKTTAIFAVNLTISKKFKTAAVVAILSGRFKNSKDIKLARIRHIGQ